jgi:hypothetical protein
MTSEKKAEKASGPCRVHQVWNDSSRMFEFCIRVGRKTLMRSRYKLHAEKVCEGWNAINARASHV